MKTCNHTFNHLAQVNKKGIVAPCCYYVQEHTPEWDQFNLANIESLDGILTSDLWNKIRSDIESGNNSACNGCWNRENANGHSKRMWSNEKPVNTMYAIEDLEIGLDTTCNMMCRICQPSQSSKWASASDVLEKLNKLQIPYGHQYNQEIQNPNTRNDLMRVLNNTDLSHINAVRINGGEPFYSKNLLPLLKQLDNQAGIENISLSFNTNGSIFPKDNVLDILSRAKDITIDISIDAINKLASVTRHGIAWNVIDSNIHKFVSKFGKDNIRLSSVISLLNVNRIQELYDYVCNAQVRSWTWQFLRAPEYLSVYQVPIKIREKWKIKHENDWKGLHYNEELMSPHTSEKLFDLFLQATNIIDTYHDCTFESVNPEMYNLIKLLKH
jgi:MoaA/NifB/PqqE/SkfB family radical SAM enzyme